MRAVLMSYLFLYTALTQLFLGALALLCFRAIVPAKWLEPLVPALRRLLRLRWLLPPLFVLLALAAPHLYPWASHAIEGSTFRKFYLSPWAFLLRGILYWAIWHILARAALERRPWAGTFGFVLLLLTGTFAAVDWLLSLEDHFPSSIFGLLFLMSSFLLAFGLSSFASAARSRETERQDQGSVHLALICTWTYLAFIQFLVIWAGNRPVEAAWYDLRSRHGWEWIPALLALFQFLAPLLALVQSPLKRRIVPTKLIALASVFGQLLFLYWQALPEARETALPGWSDLLAFAVLGAFLFNCGRRAYVPVEP